MLLCFPFFLILFSHFKDTQSFFFRKSANALSTKKCSMKTLLSKLIERKDLSSTETEELWSEMLSGADPIQVIFVFY